MAIQFDKLITIHVFTNFVYNLGFKFLIRPDHDLCLVEWGFWLFACFLTLSLSAYLIAQVFWSIQLDILVFNLFL